MATGSNKFPHFFTDNCAILLLNTVLVTDTLVHLRRLLAHSQSPYAHDAASRVVPIYKNEAANCGLARMSKYSTTTQELFSGDSFVHCFSRLGECIIQGGEEDGELVGAAVECIDCRLQFGNIASKLTLQSRNLCL
jgi:hypothetical protein